MATNLERRIDSLESLSRSINSAAQLTDRELLAIVAPNYTGPMPPADDLPARIHAWLVKPNPARPALTDGLTGQERYMRMLNGPIKGGAHGDA